jgi:2-polyprenyl-6-methoxyphenol 4-hydroxylase
MQISEPEKYYDLIVVGGGMVGASFACALSNVIDDTEFSILVIEAVVPSHDLASQSSFDARSTALSYGSKQIFESMGLWSRLGDVVAAINEIHVSEKGRLGSVQLGREEQQVDALGYVVENQDLGLVLNTALEESSRVGLFQPATVSSIKATQKGMRLQVVSGEKESSIDTSLLVLADGGRSPICQQLGIKQSIQSYDQYALISNIVFEKPHNNIAFERFTDTGPLAVLPLRPIDGKNRGSLVWTLTESQAIEYKEINEEKLLQELQERFGYRLGAIQAIGERFVYPLRLSLAKEQVRPGIVLLGNVAHTIHPVAGQGLNLALRDVMALVDVLSGAHEQGLSPGAMSVLLDYVEQQRSDQALTTHATDVITRLFSNNNEAKIWFRKFGLLAIDMLPKVRRSFAEHAMGLSKNL